MSKHWGKLIKIFWFSDSKATNHYLEVVAGSNCQSDIFDTSIRHQKLEGRWNRRLVLRHGEQEFQSQTTEKIQTTNQLKSDNGPAGVHNTGQNGVEFGKLLEVVFTSYIYLNMCSRCINSIRLNRLIEINFFVSKTFTKQT